MRGIKVLGVGGDENALILLETSFILWSTFLKIFLLLFFACLFVCFPRGMEGHLISMWLGWVASQLVINRFSEPQGGNFY